MADSHQFSWQTATVTAVDTVATHLRRIVLSPERPRPAAPGTHVDVEVQIRGQLTTRSYSVVDAAPDGSEVALTVRLDPASRGGSEFMHALVVGDQLRVTQPLQDFPLRVGAPSYVLVAGGIGITAISPMADLLHRLGAEYRIHYAGRSTAEMAYVERLRARHGDRLHLHRSDEGEVLRVPELIRHVPASSELYMCGPIRLMDEVRREWLDRGLDPTNLRYETFGNSGWFDPEPFVVDVPRWNARVEVGPEESMLEALERSGVDMMWDCRRGECGLCQVKVTALEGVVDHRDVFFSERQKRTNEYLCACVSRIASPTTQHERGRPPCVRLEVS